MNSFLIAIWSDAGPSVKRCPGPAWSELVRNHYHSSHIKILNSHFNTSKSGSVRYGPTDGPEKWSETPTLEEGGGSDFRTSDQSVFYRIIWESYLTDMLKRTFIQKNIRNFLTSKNLLRRWASFKGLLIDFAPFFKRTLRARESRSIFCENQSIFEKCSIFDFRRLQSLVAKELLSPICPMKSTILIALHQTASRYISLFNNEWRFIVWN